MRPLVYTPTPANAPLRGIGSLALLRLRIATGGVWSGLVEIARAAQACCDLAREFPSFPSVQDLFVGGRFFGWLPLFSLGRAFRESTSSE